MSGVAARDSVAPARMHGSGRMWSRARVESAWAGYEWQLGRHAARPTAPAAGAPRAGAGGRDRRWNGPNRHFTVHVVSGGGTMGGGTRWRVGLAEGAWDIGEAV